MARKPKSDLGEVVSKIVTSATTIKNEVQSDYNVGKNAVLNPLGITNRPTEKRSVISNASNAVMDFPLLVSSSVSPNAAKVTSKLIELLYASFVEAAISLQAAIDLDKGESIKTLIGRVHNNITVRESAEFDYTPLEEDIRDMVINTMDNGAHVEIGELKPDKRNSYSFYEVVANQTPNPTSKIPSPVPDRYNDLVASQGSGNSKGAYRVQDIEKAVMSIQPLPFVGEVTVYTGKGGAIARIKFNYSIRVVPHPIESSDVVQTLKDVVVTHAGRFKWIQVLTGEKGLISDLLFGIDDIKKDYVPEARGDKWFGTLRRLARLQKDADGYLKESKIPTGSLLVSQSDIDELCGISGLKFGNSMMSMICDHFTLMGIYIIDESIGSLKVFLADRPKIEVYSIDDLINLTKRSKMISSSELMKLSHI